MILADMHAIAKEDQHEIGTLHTVGATLQMALELQRAKIVKVLIGLPGFNVSSINVGRLYTLRDESGFLSGNRQLQARLRNVQRDMCEPSKKKLHYPLYQKAVSRFFHSISPILLRLLRTSTSTQEHDIFFWLVCQGNEEIARAVWARCKLPVHVALLGSAISRKMAAVLVEPSKSQALERAQRMQEWAVGLLDLADEDHARQILGLQVCELFIRPNTCMDVAMATGAKMFLTQRHCVKLMSLAWRGGIPGSSIAINQSFNYPMLLLYVLLPPVNPYLWHMTEEKKEALQRAAVAKPATPSSTRSA
jgi:hypothetical protein